MGKLAELAGTKQLKGAVSVTFKDGTSRSFESESAAEEALTGTDVFHHRGAFYEKGCTPRGYEPPKAKVQPKAVAAPVAVAEPADEAEDKSASRRSRRKRND